MSRSVVTAVSDRWESALVTTLERGTDARIARRCPDLADLLAVAGSGLAEVALVSADLRSLDRTALDHLRECSVTVVGVYPPGDETALSGICASWGSPRSSRRTPAPSHPGGAGRAQTLTWRRQGPGRAGSRKGWGQRILSGPDGPDGPAARHTVVRSLAGPLKQARSRPDGEVQAGAIIAVWGPGRSRTNHRRPQPGQRSFRNWARPTVLVDADAPTEVVARRRSRCSTERKGLAAAAPFGRQTRARPWTLPRPGPAGAGGLARVTGPLRASPGARRVAGAARRRTRTRAHPDPPTGPVHRHRLWFQPRG